MVGQVAYVGNVGRNQLTRTYVNTINPLTKTRPLSAFGQIDEKRFDGIANFNGLQSSLTKSFAKGWLVQAQYLWGNSISDNAGSGEGGQIQNIACRACDRGPSDYDIRHTFTANGVYQLPFARTKWYGGWDLSGMFVARTGRPFSVTVSRSSGTVPSGQTQNQRADYLGGDAYAADPSPALWLNPKAFGRAGLGHVWNIGTEPIQWTRSLAGRHGPCQEVQRVGRQFSIDFRAEAFNVFNRAQFGEPVANFSDSTFGRILVTANDGATGTGTSRQLQFMLRLNF